VGGSQWARAGEEKGEVGFQLSPRQPVVVLRTVATVKITPPKDVFTHEPTASKPNTTGLSRDRTWGAARPRHESRLTSHEPPSR
jgi:hypothetical protein